MPDRVTHPGPFAPLAYLSGRYLPATEAAVPVWDRGVVQGATVTEMVRTFRRVPFRLTKHLNRLRRSLDYLEVAVAESDDDFKAIVEKLIESFSATLPADADLGIVIFVTAGSLPMYAGDCPVTAGPTVCVHAFPLPFRLWAAKYQQGQALVVPSIRQIPAEILDPQVKYRSRLHWYLADREAQRVDPTAVALLQNAHGHLTETNSGNFFVVVRGRLLTASERDTLPGISQQFVKELAVELEIPYAVGDITVEDAQRAEEAFVTSTTYCVLPVSRLNGQPIGGQGPGPVTRRLLAQWSAKIGLDIVKQANQDSEHS